MFNERKNEVKAWLDAAASQMASEGVYITSPEDQAKIREVLDKYFGYREKALEEALTFLNNGNDSADNLTSQWRKHLLEAGSNGSSMISDALKDLKNQSVFADVVWKTAFQESVFFTRLAHMPLPDSLQGRLIAYRKEFEIEKESLQDKWEDLVGKDEDIDEKIDEASQTLLRVYKENLLKVDAANTKARENISKWLKTAHLADEATSPETPSLLEPVNMMMEALNQLRVTSEDLARRFDALYRSEESVVVFLFGKTRESVKQFLEKTNLDKATKEYAEAEQTLKSVSATMETKGMQDDALQFVNEGTKITKAHLEAFTEAYNEFVDAFKEIFIGPVGSKTVENLVEKQRWDAAKNEWVSLNIQTELKKIYDDAREWLSVDLGEQSEAVKEQVRKLLEQERNRLEPALKEAGDNSTFEALKILMTVYKDQLWDKIRGL